MGMWGLSLTLCIIIGFIIISKLVWFRLFYTILKKCKILYKNVCKEQLSLK